MKLPHSLIALFLLKQLSFGSESGAGSSADFSPLSYYLALPLQDLPASQGANPAWLKAMLPEKVLYRCEVSHAGGDLHLPYAPRSSTNFITLATGSQSLGEKQLFTGTFGYRYQLLDDKLWVHNRAPYNGNPFLFGDSTLGGFQLRGMFWEAGYSRSAGDHWYNGLALFYNVDEEYKTVFPKSQVKHRDLQLRLGTGWLFQPDKRLGLQVSYFDFQENLKTTQYTLEQDKSPVFIKIRATDNPLLAHGQTSEERLFAIQGFNLLLDGSWLVARSLVTYQAGAEQAQAQNVDGGAYPIAQGRWYSQRSFYQTELLNKFGKRMHLLIFSHGHLTSQWAQHPEIQQKIYTLRTRQLTGGLQLQWHLTSRWQTTPTVYYTSATYKRSDLYNGNLQYFPQKSLGYEQFIRLNRLAGAQLELGGGLETYTATSQIFFERQDWYYQQITTREIEYYQTAKRVSWGELRFYIPTSSGRSFGGSLRYVLIKPTTSPFSAWHRREQLTFNFTIGY